MEPKLGSSITSAPAAETGKGCGKFLGQVPAMYLIGDSTLAAIPEYDDVQARSSSTFAAEPCNVMVCTLSVKGQQSEDIKRKKLGGVVEAASCAAPTVGGVGGAAAGAQFGNALNAPSVKSNGKKD